MGNNLQRGDRCQQNTQETPWNLRFQNTKQRTPRCWVHHSTEGCFCLPWKKGRTLKARQSSPKGNERVTPASIQGNANQTPTEELCYVLINHSAFRKQPSGNSAEVYYENIAYKAERPRESLGGTETEYSLVHVPSTPRYPPHPESDYDLLMPSKISQSLQ
ncbi:germinal center-associated signaling and motility protein [Dipodomys merriami]|uniref:germinal center-associated signaling and motility protein n=1 Tax=Dipodomys merriami TaxID=94247 RepID=UPI0038556CF4